MNLEDMCPERLKMRLRDMGPERLAGIEEILLEISDWLATEAGLDNARALLDNLLQTVISDYEVFKVRGIKSLNKQHIHVRCPIATGRQTLRRRSLLLHPHRIITPATTCNGFVLGDCSHSEIKYQPFFYVSSKI